MTKRQAASTQAKSNGRHKVKAAKPQPESHVLPDRHATSARRGKRAMQHQEHKVEKFQGLLQDFNMSPKGAIEGFVLHSDGQTVQVNVSPEVGFAVVRGIGQNVEATVEPDTDAVKHGKGDHPVYSLVSLTGTDGKALIFAGPGDGQTVTVHGVVKRINYDRHGVANGVVLNSGDFVHLKPEGMKRVGLKAGDPMTVEGTAALMPLGQQVIEAKTVNGVAVASKKPRRPAANKVR